MMPESEIAKARQAPFWPNLESLAHTLIYDYEILGERILGEPLPQAWADAIAVPVLIFEGGHSPATLRNVVTSLEAILPHATKRTLAGQGHGAPASVLAPILESFFGG